MSIDLKKISNQENNLIQEADEKLEEEFVLCTDGLSLLESIKNVQRKFKIFSYFYSNIYNSFLLSILSAIRKHSNQSIML